MNINKNGFGSKYTNNQVSHGSALKRGGSTSNSDNSFTPSVRNISHHQQQQQQYNCNQAHCYSRNVQSPSGPDDGHLSSAYTSRQSPFTTNPPTQNQHALDSYLERFKAIAELKAVRKLESLNARSHDATTLVQEFERECAAPARTLLLKIVSVDLEYFQVHRCERIYWKFLCYSLLDKLNPGDGKNQEEASSKIGCLSTVLSDNDKFYQALSDVLSSVYHFAPSNPSVSPSARKPPIALAGGTSNERTEKLCIFLAHWIAVARGDLARYAPDAPPSAAAEWYNAAIQLYPKMGHAYNQMGVVSVSARKPLDALYYFTRSLAAPFPSQSAHHSLQALFEDIRRRSVAFRHHAKLLPPPCPDSKGQAVLERLLTKTKTEIWIRPDGCKNPSQNGHSPPGLLISLGLPETEHLALGTPAYDTLKRCFVLNFIHCHAKLYTRTDVESFEIIARDALTQFQALLNLGSPSGNSLSGSPQFLTPSRLLQIFAINMFAVERCSAASRSLTLYDPAHRPLVLERALQLSVEMFADVIALFGNRSLSQQRKQQLLPCARIWVDWMLGNTSVWNPLPGPILEQSDFGSAMASFANRVVALSMEFARCDDFELLKSAQSAQSARLLQEDCMLRGFVPLLMCSPTSAGRNAGPSSGNADKALNGAEAQKIDYETALRIEKIKPFGDVLMGLDPAVLDYDKSTSKYVSLIGVDRTPPQHDEIPTENLDELYTREQLDSLADLHQTTLGNAMEKMQLKNTQKQEPELKAKMEEFRQKLKVTHSKHTIIEIRPSYLVCDTNCLIDHLVALQAILKWNGDDQGEKSVSQNGYGPGESAIQHGANKGQSKMQYTLLIPLVVVHELEKLAGEQNSASNEPYSNQHHAKYDTFQQHRAECARAALEFIHQNLRGNQKRPSIAPRSSSLLILTGRGNLLENLHYTTELSDSSGDEGVSNSGSSKARKSANRGYSTRNDDIILRGCLKLIELQRRPNVSQRRDHSNALDGLATNLQQADMLARSTVRIERDVVFFTDDQNLKIKSHTLMVPTCSVGYFMKWACIPF